MPGLQLTTGLSLSGSGGTGNYSPLTPASTSPPSSYIGNQAYGISGSGANTRNDNVAWVGSVGFGVVALALLAYIWWSLPR